MGTCSSNCSTEIAYEEQNAKFLEPSIDEEENSTSEPSRDQLTTDTDSNSGGESLTTCVDFSLFEKQNDPRYYCKKIKEVGQLGAVRDFMEGNESAAICWIAFADDSLYIDRPQLCNFFEHCIQYVEQSNDASLRVAFQEEKIYQMVQTYISVPFGIHKTRLNQREFWCIADRIQATFDAEKTATLSTQEIDIAFCRKQSLIKSFYLSDDTSKMNPVIFKLFAGNAKRMTIVQFQDMVRHSIMFFSQKDECELESSGDLYSVVAEVMLDVLNGETLETISFARFVNAGSELRQLFEQLIEVWKRRDKLQKEQMEAAGIATDEKDKVWEGKAMPEDRYLREYSMSSSRELNSEEHYHDGIKSLDSDDEDDWPSAADADMENAI